MNTRTFLFLAVVAIPNATLGLAGCAEETSSLWCDGIGVVRGKIGPDGKCVRRDATDGFEWADAMVVIPEAGLDVDAATSADAAPADAKEP